MVQYEFNVYIKNLMIAGHGNSALKEWSSAALAEAIDVDEKTIRSYQKYLNGLRGFGMKPVFHGINSRK